MSDLTRLKSSDFEIFNSNWVVIDSVQELLEIGFRINQIDNQTMTDDSVVACIVTNDIINKMMEVV